jgi:hypothetical protein
MKQEITDEQKSFKLDPLTLNNQFTYWLVKSGCMWNLRETNKHYDKFRLTFDHATSMELVKKKMFEVGKKS